MLFVLSVSQLNQVYRLPPLPPTPPCLDDSMLRGVGDLRFCGPYWKITDPGLDSWIFMIFMDFQGSAGQNANGYKRLVSILYREYERTGSALPSIF